LPGYSLLLNEQHQADRLTDRPRGARLAFLDSMERLGEAVEIVCRRHDARFRRINLEIISLNRGAAPSPEGVRPLSGACRWRLRERRTDRVEHGHVPVDERV
jgi:hypothetical protein